MRTVAAQTGDWTKEEHPCRAAVRIREQRLEHRTRIMATRAESQPEPLPEWAKRTAPAIREGIAHSTRMSAKRRPAGRRITT